MPHENRREKLVESLIQSAAANIVSMDDSDEEDMIDETFANVIDDLVIALCVRNTVERKVIPKSQYWYQHVLPNLDDERFKLWFRMGRESFDVVLNIIKDNEVFNSARTTLQLPIRLQLAIVLFRLGECSSVRKTASLFGVGDGGTILNLTRRVFTAFLAKTNQFIYWPNTLERMQLCQVSSRELPNCIGYIDGSEIKLNEAPRHDPESYFSRKKQYSIKIQAVCDHTKKIRQITVGYPGSVHDARIFNECQLNLNPQNYFSGEEYIVGDSAYTLKDTVITPYRRNNNFVAEKEQKNFNRHLSKYRVRIEHTFGILKERFSSLKDLRMSLKDEESSRLCCQWINVCCILHNIINERNCPVDYFEYNLEEDHEADEGLYVGNYDHTNAQSKRRAIYRLLVESGTIDST